jgi:hypothetical protein
LLFKESKSICWEENDHNKRNSRLNKACKLSCSKISPRSTLKLQQRNRTINMHGQTHLTSWILCYWSLDDSGWSRNWDLRTLVKGTGNIADKITIELHLILLTYLQVWFFKWWNEVYFICFSQPNKMVKASE